MDYACLVVALDPFWMDVKFELVPASGIFDGVVCDVNDEDEWKWADKHVLKCVLGRSCKLGVGSICVSLSCCFCFSVYLRSEI